MASSELIKWGKANAMSELSLIKAAEMFVEAEQYENAAKMLYILPNEIRYFDGTALARSPYTARFELVRLFFISPGTVRTNSHRAVRGSLALPISAIFTYFQL